jgi:MFS family permease
MPEPVRSLFFARFHASGIGRAFAERNFRLFTIGSIFSLIGQWTQRIGIGWMTWELTHSGTWLGLIAFADLFPTVVITPFAGVIADRIDRRRIMTVTQTLAMLQAIALAALTLTGLIDIWSLFFLALFLGIVMSFNVAARLALMAGIARRENLPAAIGISAAVFNGARFVGPAVGGFIIAEWGVGGAFIFNAFSFFALIVALAMMRDFYREEKATRKGGMFGQIGEGFAYARHHRGIGPMLIVITAVAFGIKPYMELLPGVADHVYGGGAETLAQLTAAAGLGALVVALWLAQRGSMRGLTTIALVSMAVAGIAILVFSVTDIYWLGLVCAFVAGAGMTVSGTGTQTLMQSAVEGTMRGRVMSLYGIIFRGAPALGALLLGTLSEFIGLQPALAIGAATTILVFMWLWRLRRVTARALERDPVS